MSGKHPHKAKHRKKKFPLRRFLKVTTVYFLLFVALLSMVDYYAWMNFDFLYFIAFSALLAVGLGYYHVRYGRRDHVDDIANELL